MMEHECTGCGSTGPAHFYPWTAAHTPYGSVMIIGGYLLRHYNHPFPARPEVTPKGRMQDNYVPNCRIPTLGEEVPGRL